jgi:hypothetical protein
MSLYNPNGLVIYDGPSMINSEPIIMVAVGFTSKSKNSKTGAMLQTYILTRNVSPLDALKTGADVAICGGCIHRPKVVRVHRYGDDLDHAARGNCTEKKVRSCYVQVGQAPQGIWKTFHRGRYSTEWSSEDFRDRPVRLGAYGDPAAVPVPVWERVMRHVTQWTGYTHQSANMKLHGVLQWCQVSADQVGDSYSAREAGCGSFRVLAPNEKPASFEVLCPASEEAGKLTTCASCMMCSGPSGAHVYISAHGAGKKHYSATKRRALQLMGV